MKEIAIKIPDKVYESVIEEGFSVRNARELIHAMVNGKILPKGHTELIDAKILIQDFCMAEENMKGNGITPVFDVHEITDMILSQEVTVEADEEDEE